MVIERAREGTYTRLHLNQALVSAPAHGVLSRTAKNNSTKVDKFRPKGEEGGRGEER